MNIEIDNLKYGDLAAIQNHLKPTKTRKEIAAEYGIDPHTLKNWFKRDKLEIPSGDISPKFQHLIYETYGIPPIKG
ncbi:MAG: hypothetical protein J0M29_21665 [Chitinophagales bacterium]|nr:hypothetical protein [Chitinophagales bacterium]